MSNLTTVERAVRAAWNGLPDDHPAPVKQIAKDLDMVPADVAFVVYPAETFGAWCDCQEPDLCPHGYDWCDECRWRGCGECFDEEDET